MLVGLILGFTILGLLWYFMTRLPPSYPPTPPIRLPILGHFHYFLWIRDSESNSALYKMFKRYSKNDVLTLHIGTERMTMIGSYQLARDLLSSEATNSRSNSKIMKLMKNSRNSLTGMEGVLFSNGKTHKEQRKFMLTSLREFGYGKSEMESLINDEVSHLCEGAEETLKLTINNDDNMFLIPILNVLWRIVAGERYDYKDQKMKTLMQMLEKYMLETKLLQPNITWFLPFLAKMFPNLEGSVEGLKGEPGDIRHFLSETIQHHKDTLDANNIRDFIDAYLIEMKEKGEEKSSFYDDVGYENLVNVLLDLFIAGTDTSSLTLTFGIIFLTNNQSIQEKIRQEIYEVIGKERQPSLSDRHQMHYTEATLLEIQRTATGVFGPEGLFRVTQAPLNAGTCTIPSGHILVTQLGEILMGEKSWKDPKRFDPTRFIDAGKFQRDDRVINFQIGKRVCPGESLAKAQLFLFLVGLIQKFKFEPAEGPGALVNYDVVPGGVTWKPERHDNINMIRI